MKRESCWHSKAGVIKRNLTFEQWIAVVREIKEDDQFDHPSFWDYWSSGYSPEDTVEDITED